MSGFHSVLLGAGAKAPVDITVTCDQFDSGLPPPDDFVTNGYSDTGSLGSRSPSGYVDAAGVSRTVTECHINGGSTVTPYFVFGLDGTNRPNNNLTFRQLVVNGTVLDRADASYDASENGDTYWVWTSGTLPTIPSSGNITLTIRF